jgi:hypothetical protein
MPIISYVYIAPTVSGSTPALPVNSALQLAPAPLPSLQGGSPGRQLGLSAIGLVLQVCFFAKGARRRGTHSSLTRVPRSLT